LRCEEEALAFYALNCFLRLLMSDTNVPISDYLIIEFRTGFMSEYNIFDKIDVKNQNRKTK